MDVKGCGRLSVHDGLLDVAWFCLKRMKVDMFEDDVTSPEHAMLL